MKSRSSELISALGMALVLLTLFLVCPLLLGQGAQLVNLNGQTAQRPTYPFTRIKLVEVAPGQYPCADSTTGYIIGCSPAGGGALGAAHFVAAFGATANALGDTSGTITSSSYWRQGDLYTVWPGLGATLPFTPTDDTSGGNELGFVRANQNTNVFFVENASNPCTNSTKRADSVIAFRDYMNIEHGAFGYTARCGAITDIYGQVFGTSSFWECSAFLNGATMPPPCRIVQTDGAGNPKLMVEVSPPGVSNQYFGGLAGGVNFYSGNGGNAVGIVSSNGGTAAESFYNSSSPGTAVGAIGAGNTNAPTPYQGNMFLTSQAALYERAATTVNFGIGTSDNGQYVADVDSAGLNAFTYSNTGEAHFKAVNDTNKFGAFGIRGSAASYGYLASNKTFVYSQTGIALIDDEDAGAIQLAVGSGGGTLGLTVTKTGVAAALPFSAPSYSVGGTAGLTTAVTISGCTLTFNSGLLTAKSGC